MLFPLCASVWFQFLSDANVSSQFLFDRAFLFILQQGLVPVVYHFCNVCVFIFNIVSNVKSLMLHLPVFPCSTLHDAEVWRIRWRSFWIPDPADNSATMVAFVKA